MISNNFKYFIYMVLSIFSFFSLCDAVNALSVDVSTDLNGEVISHIAEGERYRYKIIVKNTSTETKEKIKIQSNISNNLIITDDVEYLDAAVYDNVIIWNIDSLNKGESQTFFVEVEVPTKENRTTYITSNTVTVTCGTENKTDKFKVMTIQK